MTGWRFWAVLVPAVVLAGTAGIVGGVFAATAFHGNVSSLLAGKGWNPQAQTATATNAARQLFTCSMHRQVIQDHPGSCPICHMDLVPMEMLGGSASEVIIDPVVVQNMGIRTAMPELGMLRQTIRAVGTLTEPEQNHTEINLRVNGWIEKLYANQEGAPIGKGDPLFELYSPEITAAADELIAAHKATAGINKGDAAVLQNSAQAVLSAGRRKLELLGLSAEQIATIEKLDKAPATVTIVSPMGGHIAEKNVIEGSAVKAGDKLMKIADRSSMWMVVQVFEQQLGLVQPGAKVTTTIAAVPGKTFQGTVDFIYPHLDPSTRTAMVRVLLPNEGHALHENMYAEAEIETAGDNKASILVPREAVIDSGVRQVVFLKTGEGHFAAREVKVGRAGRVQHSDGTIGGTMIQILSGLTDEDTVVTSGQFLLDSESRIEEAQRKFLAPGDDKTIK